MPSDAEILTPDEVDDLIYFARVGDLDSLKETVETLSRTKTCTTLVILRSAVDIDEDGLGSGSCLLHYPAANGNIDIVKYLLSHASPATPLLVKENGSQEEQNLSGNKEGIKFVNHQNISGNTPLHWAGMNGHLEVVKALMEAGADAGIVNSAGRDAVFESDVSSKEGAAECAVEMLKTYEGLEKANEVTADGDTANDVENDQQQSEPMNVQNIHDPEEQSSSTGQR